MTLRSDLYVILQNVKNVRLGDSLDPSVDSIFAAFAEAMTSPDAVDAACDAMYMIQDDDGWTEGERRCTSDGLTAALAAVGVVEREGDE